MQKEVTELTKNPVECDQPVRVARIAPELERLWQEEASETAYRLARAEYAEEQGFFNAASTLREVAKDELRHLVMVTRLLAPEEIEGDLPAMFAAMINADSRAAESAGSMAQVAREAGLEEEAALFEQLAVDELSHVRRLEKALAGMKGNPCE
jgi:rubrerythrin